MLLEPRLEDGQDLIVPSAQQRLEVLQCKIKVLRCQCKRQLW